MCRIADAISPLEGIETVVEETEDSPALTMQLARLRVLKPFDLPLHNNEFLMQLAR